MRQRVTGGVDASSVEERQEGNGDGGQQLEGACEQEACLIGGVVEEARKQPAPVVRARKRASAPLAKWMVEAVVVPTSLAEETCCYDEG